jgi:hypothetical protein
VTIIKVTPSLARLQISINNESWAGSKKGQGLSQEAEAVRKKAGVHH